MFLSNIFAINDTQEVRWSRFLSPFKIFSIISSEDLSSELTRENPLLASYLRLLSEGIPCVWFYTNQTQQELWTFEFGSSSQSILKETNHLLSQLNRAETGIWCRSKHTEDIYVTELLFKAIRNRIEWLMSDRSFFKAGDSLIFCNQPDRKAAYSITLDLFFHGNSICLNVVVKQSKLIPYSWNSSLVGSLNGTSSTTNGKESKTKRGSSLLFCGRQMLPGYVRHSTKSEKEFNSVKRQWKSFFNWDADKISNFSDPNSLRMKRSLSSNKSEIQKMVSISLSGIPYCLPTNSIFQMIPLESSSSFLTHTLRKQSDLEKSDSSSFSNLLRNEGVLPFGMFGKKEQNTEGLDWAWKRCDPFAFLDGNNSGLVLNQNSYSTMNHMELSSPPAIPPSPSPSPIQKTPIQNFVSNENQISTSPSISEIPISQNEDSKKGKRKGERTNSNKPNKKMKEEDWGNNEEDDSLSLDDMKFSDSDFNSWISTMVPEDIPQNSKMEEEILSESVNQTSPMILSTSDSPRFTEPQPASNSPFATDFVSVPLTSTMNIKMENGGEEMTNNQIDARSTPKNEGIEENSNEAKESTNIKNEETISSIQNPFAKVESSSTEVAKPISFLCPPSYAPVLAKPSLEKYSYAPELNKNSPTSIAMRSASPIYSEVSVTPPPYFNANSSSDDEISDSDSDDDESSGETDSNRDETSNDSKSVSDELLELEEFVKKTVYSSNLEPNSALVSLLLDGIYQPLHIRSDPTQDSQWTAAHLLNAEAIRNNSNGQNLLTSEQCELNEHLSVGGYDGQPFWDINSGVYAKLGVEYALRHRKRRKTRSGNPFLWNMDWVAMTEEPQQSALDLVIYPLDEIPESNSIDLVKQVSTFLQPLLDSTFSVGTQKTERQQPLGFVKFCSLDASHSEPLLLSLGEEDFAEALPTPNFIVGYQEEWISVQPTILNVWEKSRIEPYSLKKHVQYHVLAPNNPSIAHHFITFFKELTSMYEICNFGKHQSINNQSNTLGGITLVPTPSNSQGVASSYVGECIKLGKQIIAGSTEYSDHCCSVVYIVNPFNDIEPMKEMLNAVASLIRQTSQHPNVNLVFQLVPIQHTLQFTDLSSVLKEIAFTVFTKVRRISSSNLFMERQSENRIVPPRLFEPLFILSSSSPPNASGGVASSPSFAASNPTTPSNTPMTPGDHSGNSSTTEIEGTPTTTTQYSGRDPILHCSYMLSDDERRLLCTFTDDRGELLETSTILIRDEGVHTTVPKLFRRLWNCCKQNLALVDLSTKWKLVLGKFGELSPFELKEWKSIISESLSNKDDLCCSLESIVVVSLKFDRSLQLFLQKEDIPKNYNPSASYAFFPKVPPHSSSSETPLGVSFIVTPVPTSADQKPFDFNRTAKLAITIHWTSNHPKSESGFRSQSVDVHDLLRTITHQYFNLSWLTATPMWPRRRSTLPLHFAILKRMSRWSMLQ